MLISLPDYSLNVPITFCLTRLNALMFPSEYPIIAFLPGQNISIDRHYLFGIDNSHLRSNVSISLTYKLLSVEQDIMRGESWTSYSWIIYAGITIASVIYPSIWWLLYNRIVLFSGKFIYQIVPSLVLIIPSSPANSSGNEWDYIFDSKSKINEWFLLSLVHNYSIVVNSLI